jgi:hypothetical protein
MKILGAALRLVGFLLCGLFALLLLVVIFDVLFLPRGGVSGSEVAGMSLGMALFFLPLGLIGWAALRVGSRLRGDAPVSSASPRFLARLAVVVAGLGAAMIVQVYWLTRVRIRHYEEDRANMSAGAPSEQVLSHLTHADRVNVVWKDEAPDLGAPKAVYPFENGTVERPRNKQGRPLGISSCRLTYRIFVFERRIITVDFDADDKVSSVHASSLD